jgi:hypothetical protein
MKYKKIALFVIFGLLTSFYFGGCKTSKKNSASQPTAKPIPEETAPPGEGADPVKRPKPR